MMTRGEVRGEEVFEEKMLPEGERAKILEVHRRM